MKRLAKALDFVEETALVLLLSLVVVVAFADVLVRNLGIPMSKVQEFLPNLLVWIVWLGVPYAVRKDENFRVQLIPRRLRDRAGPVVSWIGAVAVGAFFCMAGWYGISVVLLDLETGAATPLGYPSAWLDAAMPVGSALALLRLGQRLARERKKEPPA